MHSRHNRQCAAYRRKTGMVRTVFAEMSADVHQPCAQSAARVARHAVHGQRARCARLASGMLSDTQRQFAHARCLQARRVGCTDVLCQRRLPTKRGDHAPCAHELRTIPPPPRLTLGDRHGCRRRNRPSKRGFRDPPDGAFKASPAHIEKHVGRRVYSLEPNVTRPEACRPARNRFESLRRGKGKSKHFV
jgi:hypothetical protein